jgi:UPF0176 protein
MEADNRPYNTISFYRYYSIPQPKEFRDQLFIDWTPLEVVGRVYVAEEGINAQIALPSEHFEAFKNKLHAIDFLSGIRLNTAIEENQKAFIKLDVKVRPKIVADGIEDPTFNPSDTGKYMEAKDWNSALADPDTVVIDMRNHYESEVGRFENAECPDVDTFRDELKNVIDRYAEDKEKRILMYCTGGIRCEKASAWFKHRGFGNVYQLDGGIIKYANECKSQGLENKFLGKNFVFDERRGERISDDIISECHQCGAPCDTHTNCAFEGCHLLFLQCDNCKSIMENCCSDECKTITHLPEEEQKELRKKLTQSNLIFKKGRFEPNKLKTNR